MASAVLASLPWRPALRAEPLEPADTGVPIPTRPAYRVGEGKHLRLFADLKVGQSRSFPYPQREMVAASAKEWGKRHGGRFSVRRDPRDSERARIWRVE